MLKCCFTSTETVGLLGTGAQDGQCPSLIGHLASVDVKQHESKGKDGHLHFHTAPELGEQERKREEKKERKKSTLSPVSWS